MASVTMTKRTDIDSKIDRPTGAPKACEEAMKIRGRKVYVDGALIAEIAGDRANGYSLRMKAGWVAPWPVDGWRRLVDLKRDIRDNAAFFRKA